MIRKTLSQPIHEKNDYKKEMTRSNISNVFHKFISKISTKAQTEMGINEGVITVDGGYFLTNNQMRCLNWYAKHLKELDFLDVKINSNGWFWKDHLNINNSGTVREIATSYEGIFWRKKIIGSNIRNLVDIDKIRVMNGKLS